MHSKQALCQLSYTPSPHHSASFGCDWCGHSSEETWVWGRWNTSLQATLWNWDPNGCPSPGQHPPGRGCRTSCCLLFRCSGSHPCSMPWLPWCCCSVSEHVGQTARQAGLPWGGCPSHWAGQEGPTHGWLVSTPLVPPSPSADLLGQRRWHPNSACQTPMS